MCLHTPRACPSLRLQTACKRAARRKGPSRKPSHPSGSTALVLPRCRAACAACRLANGAHLPADGLDSPLETLPSDTAVDNEPRNASTDGRRPRCAVAPLRRGVLLVVVVRAWTVTGGLASDWPVQKMGLLVMTRVIGLARGEQRAGQTLRGEGGGRQPRHSQPQRAARAHQKPDGHEVGWPVPHPAVRATAGVPANRPLLRRVSPDPLLPICSWPGPRSA